MGQILFLSIVVISLSLIWRAVHLGQASRIAVSSIATLIYLVCLWIPAQLQESEMIVSKLYRAGLSLPPTTDEIDRLSLQWATELTVVILSEALVWFLPRSYAQVVNKQHGLLQPRKTALVLVILGALSTIAFQAPGLDERAAGGQGIPTLLRTALICGLAIIIYYRAFRDWRYWLVCGVGTMWLIAANVRSPLFVLFFAYVASEISSRRERSTKKIVVTVLLVVALALGGSIMSSMRANIVRGTGSSSSEILSQTLQDPLIAPFQAGIDTLDGYRFSEKLLPIVEPRPSDLLNIVTTFVPRSLWPDKPTDLSVELSTTYLGYKGSGQYLSPIGYLSLVTGSYVGSVIALGIFSALAALLVRRSREGFWLSIVLCVIFRFFLGGSSFDIYYGLTIALPIITTQIWFRVAVRSDSVRDKQSAVSSLVPRAEEIRPPA